MKATIKKLRTFLTFDAPLEMEHISTLFASTHSQCQQLIPAWGHTSTRQKLIANYWFSDVVAHFTAMISLPVLFLWLITSHFKVGYLAVVIIVVLFYFIVTLFTTYWPSFVSNFLPKLETIMSTYQHEQQEKIIRKLEQQVANQKEQAKIEREQIIEKFQKQLSEQQEHADQQLEMLQVQLKDKLVEQQTRLLNQQEAIQNRFQQKIALQKDEIVQQQEANKKCRQAQLSNFALTLIYYVFVKAAGINSVECDDHTANLLLKLYGVDRGSLRTNLEFIAGSSSKRKNLGERKCTEIRNRFEEARDFFNEMEFPKGVSLIRDLETKILGS